MRAHFTPFDGPFKDLKINMEPHKNHRSNLKNHISPHVDDYKLFCNSVANIYIMDETHIGLMLIYRYTHTYKL